MYVCVRGSNPLGLELQTIVSCRVDAGNCTWVLWKSSQCLSSPSPLLCVVVVVVVVVVLWIKNPGPPAY